VIWRGLLFVWMAAWLVQALLLAPLDVDLGETTRVLYFHIPAAWVTVVALGWSVLFSILYLARRRMEDDDHAAAAAELGILFCIGATVSGSMWAAVKWNKAWNWDPREITIVLLLLIYGAYLALRGAIQGEERRARLSAIYSIVAFVTVPSLVFVVPRVYFSLHPDPLINPGGRVQMPPEIVVAFVAMLAGFTGLFVWMQSLKVRLLRIERARLERWAATPET